MIVFLFLLKTLILGTRYSIYVDTRENRLTDAVNEYPQFLFLRKISKYVFPCKPKIYYIKGSTLHGHISMISNKTKGIMLTCPCIVYPLTPHFYIVKLGYTYLLIFALKHRLWVLVRTASLRRF